MKQQVGPGVVAIVVIIAVIAIGWWAWKNFAPPSMTGAGGSNPYNAMPKGANIPGGSGMSGRGGPAAGMPSGGPSGPAGGSGPVAPGGGAPAGATSQ